MLTFVLPTLTSTMAGDLSFGGDSRGGATSVVGQLVSMVKHPMASIKLMVKSIFELDNFRNLFYPLLIIFFHILYFVDPVLIIAYLLIQL